MAAFARNRLLTEPQRPAKFVDVQQWTEADAVWCWQGDEEEDSRRRHNRSRPSGRPRRQQAPRPRNPRPPGGPGQRRRRRALPASTAADAEEVSDGNEAEDEAEVAEAALALCGAGTSDSEESLPFRSCHVIVSCRHCILDTSSQWFYCPFTLRSSIGIAMSVCPHRNSTDSLWTGAESLHCLDFRCSPSDCILALCYDYDRSSQWFYCPFTLRSSIGIAMSVCPHRNSTDSLWTGAESLHCLDFRCSPSDCILALCYDYDRSSQWFSCPFTLRSSIGIAMSVFPHRNSTDSLWTGAESLHCLDFRCSPSDCILALCYDYDRSSQWFYCPFTLRSSIGIAMSVCPHRNSTDSLWTGAESLHCLDFRCSPYNEIR